MAVNTLITDTGLPVTLLYVAFAHAVAVYKMDTDGTLTSTGSPFGRNH